MAFWGSNSNQKHGTAGGKKEEERKEEKRKKGTFDSGSRPVDLTEPMLPMIPTRLTLLRKA
ncbi:hypothetical protein QC760_003039 [Botrytis cinerea]